MTRRLLLLHALTAKFAALVVLAIATATPTVAQTVLRVGHFPNVTHVQALVAHYLSRHGKGWFEERCGADVKIEWYVYNAGPGAMEALFAKSIDLTYVGPNPAINAYSKARGQEVRIAAGAVDGGSALVVQSDSTLKMAADFRGKKIATPQFGNTQDVAARAWLATGGLKITQSGGDAQVIPTANPDQLVLFKQRALDAVWTVEPWVSRLELEAGGKILVEDPDAITTVLVASAELLASKRELARRFVGAHQELTQWIGNNGAEAQRMVREELDAEMHASLSAQLVASAWKRIALTADVTIDELKKFVASAQAAGFLRDAPDMGRLVERP